MKGLVFQSRLLAALRDQGCEFTALEDWDKDKVDYFGMVVDDRILGRPVIVQVTKNWSDPEKVQAFFKQVRQRTVDRIYFEGREHVTMESMARHIKALVLSVAERPHSGAYWLTLYSNGHWIVAENEEIEDHLERLWRFKETTTDKEKLRCGWVSRVGQDVIKILGMDGRTYDAWRNNLAPALLRKLHPFWERRRTPPQDMNNRIWVQFLLARRSKSGMARAKFVTLRSVERVFGRVFLSDNENVILVDHADNRFRAPRSAVAPEILAKLQPLAPTPKDLLVSFLSFGLNEDALAVSPLPALLQRHA